MHSKLKAPRRVSGGKGEGVSATLPIIPPGVMERAILLHADEKTPGLLRLKQMMLAEQELSAINGRTGLDESKMPQSFMVRAGEGGSLEICVNAAHIAYELPPSDMLAPAKLQEELKIILPKVTGQAPDEQLVINHYAYMEGANSRAVDVERYIYRYPEDVLEHMEQSKVPGMEKLLAQAKRYQAAFAADELPAKAWAETKALPAVKNTPGTDIDAVPENFEMHSYHTSKGGLLKSNGFTSCKAILVTNEDTGETTGFHFAANLSQTQRAKLHDIGLKPGRKHGQLLKGSYFDSKSDIFEDISITQTLEKLVPGIEAHPTLMVTEKPYKFQCEPITHPGWDLLVDSSNGAATITEKAHRHDAKGAERHFQIFPEVFAARAPANAPLAGDIIAPDAHARGKP